MLWGLLRSSACGQRNQRWCDPVWGSGHRERGSGCPVSTEAASGSGPLPAGALLITCDEAVKRHTPAGIWDRWVALRLQGCEGTVGKSNRTVVVVMASDHVQVGKLAALSLASLSPRATEPRSRCPVLLLLSAMPLNCEGTVGMRVAW